jgi:nitrite reductase/ring-hydroxylating ferredoxin subunit
MTYHPAAKTVELQPGAMKSVTVDGKKLLLANVDGSFYAMQQKCPHLGANLTRGKLNGRNVTCPFHAATFDVTTGEVVAAAHVLMLKFKTKQAATYPVRVDGDSVLIEA